MSVSDTEISKSETTTTKESSLSDSDTSLYKHVRLHNSSVIKYRHLVVSSCVGIFQVWWHPYVHDLPKLLPFLYAYGLLTVLVAFPLMYLELALGAVTKKSVLDCWDIAPVARGIGVSMVSTCMVAGLAACSVSCWAGALGARAGAAAWLTGAPRHTCMQQHVDTPAQSFFFNDMLHLDLDSSSEGVGWVSDELALYHVLTCTLVFLLVGSGIHTLQVVMVVKDVLLGVVLVVLAAGAGSLSGAATMFTSSHWGALTHFQLWWDALEYTLVQLSLSQGTLVVLGSRRPGRPHGLIMTARLTTYIAACSALLPALTLGAAHGALQHEYANHTVNLWKGPSASVVLWADYVTRVPGPQFWSTLVFFTFYLVAVVSVAVLVQTLMSPLPAFGRVSCLVNMLLLMLFCLAGVVTLCTQKGLYILNFLLEWPISKPRIIIGAATALVAVVYGKRYLYEDVFFATGENPCCFIKLACNYIPWVFMGMVVASTRLVERADAAAGWSVVALVVAPIFLVATFYLVFKFRVRKLICSESDEKI